MSNDKTTDPRTFAVIGAAMEVHRVLGSGFLEQCYREALAVEFAIRAIPFRREVPCRITFKGVPLGGSYRADFVCHDGVVVEVKARSSIGGAETAQVLHYLAALKHDCALVLNFGRSSLEYRRLVL